jgi:hypothetical protein
MNLQRWSLQSKQTLQHQNLHLVALTLTALPKGPSIVSKLVGHRKTTYLLIIWLQQHFASMAMAA